MINLKNIKDALSLWRTELDNLERALEQKLQRLAFLQESPLPPAELAEQVVATMIRCGDYEFHRHLPEKLGPALNNPLMDLANSEWRPGLLSSVGNPNTINVWCLFYLLRDPLTKAITAEISKLDCLPPSGPPRAARVLEIAKLEGEVASLREKIQAERQAAKVVGLDVAGLHQRDRVPARPRDLKSSG